MSVWFEAIASTWNYGTLTGNTSYWVGGLAEGLSDSGRVVLESHETENKGEILSSGGLLPVTRYNVFNERLEVIQPRISGNQRGSDDPNLYTEWNGVVDTVVGISPTWDTLDTPNWARLRTEAWARANSSAFDVLTNLAELPESVRMARDFMNNLHDRARRIRNLRKVRASRSFEEFVRVFSDAWLEYRYGWRPLVGAAQDLFEAVDKLQSPKKYEPVSGRSSQELSGSGSSGAYWVDNTFGGYDTTDSGSITVKARSFVTHLIGREAAALGVNPFVTAWELVPYSFVIDWFTGIGDSIQANFKPPGVLGTIAGSSTKSVMEYESTRRHDPVEYTLSWSPGTVKYRREDYLRWDDPLEPPPPALFSQADRMSLAQWTDLVLLAEGLLRRLFAS